MEQLGINFGALIKNEAVKMYGHEVGDEVQAVEPASLTTIPMIVVEKFPLSHGRFTYQLRGKSNPDFVAGGLSGDGGQVFLDRYAAV